MCRDESGVFFGASAIKITGMIDHVVLESLACREDLALALQKLSGGVRLQWRH
jgi:hypothetical protein